MNPLIPRHGQNSNMELHLVENGADFDLPTFIGQPRVYAIATVPRSGSTLLSKALWATGSAGAPLEYFNDRIIADYRKRWGPLTIDEMKDRLVRHRTSPNGVFGFNVQWSHFRRHFKEGGKLNFGRPLETSKVILAYRTDKIRQAVSYSRALRTNKWTSDMAAILPATYSRRHISKCLRSVVEIESIWRRFLAARQIVPLEVSYESLASDYTGTVAGVASFLEIDIDTVPAPPIEKQADQTSEEWIDRFVYEQKADPSPVAG